MTCRCGRPATHWITSPGRGAQPGCWHCIDKIAFSYMAHNRADYVRVVVLTPVIKERIYAGAPPR